MLLAAVAEHEGRLISERTKAAMDAARERGPIFARTSWHFSAESRLKAALGAERSHRARALATYADVTPIAVTLRESSETWSAIARYLNDLVHVTRSGGPWGVYATLKLVERDSYVEKASKNLVLKKFEAVRGRRASPRLFSQAAPSTTPLPENVAPVAHPNKSRVAIAYLRVSTTMEGFGGLGIAAQRSTIRAQSERANESSLRKRCSSHRRDA